ncbi:MAG: helix-turn-helix domain-containing protein, partial [Acidobacteriota bacterium]
MLKQKLDSLIDEMIDKGIRFPEARREFEKRFLSQVLDREKGNLCRASKVLRIHRNTLSKKIHDYKLKSGSRG